MTRSRNSFFRGFSHPRIFNIFAVALALGIVLTMSLPQNTAQESPTPAATETPAEQPADTPKPESEKPAETPVGTPAPVADPVKTEEKTEAPAETPKPENEKPAETSVEPPAPIVDPAKTEEKTEPSAGSSTETPTPVFQPVITEGETSGEMDGIPVGSAFQTTEEAEKAAEAKKAEEEEAARLAQNAKEWQEFWQRVKVWGIFLLVVAGTFFAGNALAKYWRLPDHNVRIFVLLLAFFGSLAAVALGWNRMTLGIDLQGGVVLVYDAKPIQRGDAETGVDETSASFDMDQLTTALLQRINPGGVREISITRLGSNSKQIQVIIPRAEDAEVDRIQRIISESGALTFRILASRLYPKDKDIIDRGEREPGREIRDPQNKLIAQWVPVYKDEESSFRNNPDIVTRERNEQLEVLVLFNDGQEITGKYLTRVGRGMDQHANPGVSFEFDSIGERKFRLLTRANLPNKAQERLKRQLGIILNESLYSAPTINDEIGRHGIITFGRRVTQEDQIKLQKDIDDLIKILNAGALPAELSKEPVSRQLIGATLGTDTIQKGKVALVSSAIVVLVFMLVYYRLAGLIACFCVITNILMLVAIMLALRAAFTLPGLAGIVLTIGMAVDANILIYERLREELQAGSSLKMAIRNAYSKALSAIVDSNITTILTGVILYSVGTEQVKGFAVTLVLGVSLSMFTAIYCARTIMDIFESWKGIKTFRMLQLFKRPNINFLGARNACAVFSIILTIIGIVAVIARGKTILDIDFVGGVSVEAVFKQSQDIRKVREKLYAMDDTIEEVAKKLNDLAVQEVQASGEAGGSISELTGAKKLENTRFIITTSIPQVEPELEPEEYLHTVRDILKRTFGDELKYCALDYSFKDGTKEGETEVQLTFFPAINYESLRSTLNAASRKAVDSKTIENDFAYALSNEEYYEGSQRSFEKWTLVAQSPGKNVENVLSPLKADLDGTPYFPTSTTVGGSVAKDTRMAGILAIVGSLVCIVLYIWFRFQGVVYGLAAVIGLIHDVLVVLGMIALSVWLATPLAFLQINEFKIGLTVVAAFLTIIGYSLNDTIILFDRIRENRGKSPILTDTMINRSINQTLSRTVLTSLTTFLVAIILYFWGGQGIHTFAFAMSVGVAFGTYSTIGLCAPLLYWMVGVEDPAKQKERDAVVQEK